MILDNLLLRSSIVVFHESGCLMMFLVAFIVVFFECVMILDDIRISLRRNTLKLKAPWFRTDLAALVSASF